MRRLLGFDTLTGKFLFLTGSVLLILFAGLFTYQYSEVSKPIEEQFMEKGKSLALSLAQSIQSVTENDLKNGVILSGGQHIQGDVLKKRLFDDHLTIIPESEKAAADRKADPEYAAAKQTLYDGSQIPVSQYELKYSSSFDAYTDERWQGLIDSFAVTDSVVFALPTFYSDRPGVAGYIPTHNTIYSPVGEASKDRWGYEGILSQKYRANRVFNDKTGYQAAAHKDQEEPLIQVYPRLIEGQIVTVWDISYPLYFQGEHWGAVRVAMSKQRADLMVKEQRFMLLLQYAGLFMIILILLSILTRSIVKKRLELLTSSVDRMFEGGVMDLTQNISIKGQDEISRLSYVWNDMVSNIRGLMGIVQRMSGQVTDSSNTLSGHVEHTMGAAIRFNETMQEVSAGSSKQAAGAKEGAIAMAEVAIGIQRIAESSSRIASSTDNVRKKLDIGEQQTLHVNGHMDQLYTSTMEMEEMIRKLQELSATIGSFAAVITAISSQTNILSFNASIEASRSGEHGKGFKVIADEIRQLSSQTRESATKITEVIGDIQTFTHQAALKMENNAAKVKDTVATVGLLTDSLKEILRTSQLVNEDIQEVSAATEEMSAGTEEIAASMDEISTIATISAGSIQTAAANYESQLQVMSDIAATSDKLASLTEELRQGLSRFKV